MNSGLDLQEPVKVEAIHSSVKNLIKDFEMVANQPEKLQQSNEGHQSSPKWNSKGEVEDVERSLSELDGIHKTLAKQNLELRQEVTLADRKLIARAERIRELEKMLQETQNRLETQKFESKMREAKLIFKEEPGSWVYSSKIAKPLRGGNNSCSNGLAIINN